MNYNKIKVAIIGCGRVAGHHARSIFQLNEKFDLVAVCDLVTDRAKQIAKSSENPLNTYSNYHRMLEDNPEIDLVSIVTPSGMHFEHSIDIIQNYKKHIIVEKPIVMTLDQGIELKNCAAKLGVHVFPVFQYRFNKAVVKVKRAVAENELGNIFLATIRTRWCRTQQYYDRDPWRGVFSHDGGACTNQGIHHLDILRYIMGEVKQVNSIMTTNSSRIEVEDTAVATIEFVNGATGVIEITTAARPDDFESSLSFVGNKGIAIIGGWATNELVKFSPDKNQEKLNSEEFTDVYGFGHKVIYEDLYDALVNGKQPLVTYEDSMKTIQLLHAMYVSAETQVWCSVESNHQSSKLGKPNENISKLYRVRK